MSGLLRRPSHRARRRLSTAAALLGFAALAVPASSQAATGTFQFHGEVPNICHEASEHPVGSFTFIQKFDLTVIDRDHVDPQIGDHLSVTVHNAVLSFDPDGVAAFYKAFPSDTPASLAYSSPALKSTNTSTKLTFPTDSSTGTLPLPGGTTASSFGSPLFLDTQDLGTVVSGDSPVTIADSSTSLSATGTQTVDGSSTDLAQTFTCLPQTDGVVATLPVSPQIVAGTLVYQYQAACTEEEAPYGSPLFPVITVRVKGPASATNGSPLQVSSTATVSLSSEAVTRLTTSGSWIANDVAVAATPLSANVTGTTTSSIPVGAGTTLQGPTILVRTPPASVTLDAGTGPAASAGTVTAAAGGAVDFTPGTFQVVTLVHGLTYVGTPITTTDHYDCSVPSGADIGSLPVAVDSGPRPPIELDKTYGISGNATLKTLVKGNLPITGSLAAQIDATTGALTAGGLTLAPSTAKLTALGFLPVVATVDLVPTAPVTGSITSSALDAVAKVRVKIPSASVFGVKIAGGSNCQAAQVSTIALKSVGTFSRSTGGTVGGTYAISNLTGCGALNGIVSSLTASGGNAIALTLQG